MARATVSRRAKVVAIAALAVLLAIGSPFAVRWHWCGDGATDEFELPRAEREPSSFEPYLERHPRNLARREAALTWYGGGWVGVPQNLEAFHRHNLALIAWHPDAPAIGRNGRHYREHPALRTEAIEKLDARIAAGAVGPEVSANAGRLEQQAATPQARAGTLFWKPFSSRERPLAGLTAEEEAHGVRAIAHFQTALALARHPWQVAAYAQDLIDLLVNLGRADDAVAVGRCLLPRLEKESPADFLVSYGRSLAAAGQIEEARQVLRRVRAVDEEWGERAPFHATADAETALGLLALRDGDVAEAARLLRSSCDVGKCCHAGSGSISLVLAEALLAAGQRDAAIDFGESLLTKFTPDDEDVRG